MNRIIIVALACIALAGCGETTLSGSYVPKGGGIGNGLVMSKLEFSGDAVTVSMMEQRLRGTYKVDGKEVIINLNGQQQVFNIDSAGCLDGGNLFGKFCKA